MSDQCLSTVEGMPREQTTIEVANVDWIDGEGNPEVPTITVGYDGDDDAVHERVLGPDGEPLPADRTDVTVRLHDSPDDPAATGIVALTDRVTGAYIVEVKMDVDDLLSFVTAARRYGERTDDVARYRIRLSTGDDASDLDHEKRTLLVYSEEGELLRSHSLIPSGVEI